MKKKEKLWYSTAFTENIDGQIYSCNLRYCNTFKKNTKFRTENAMTENYSERLRVLEEKFEYQEQTIDSLNDVIIDQQKQITELEARLQHIQSFIEAAKDAGPNGEDPPPPHY